MEIRGSTMTVSVASKRLQAAGFTMKHRGTHLIFKKDWDTIVLNYTGEVDSNTEYRIRKLIERNR